MSAAQIYDFLNHSGLLGGLVLLIAALVKRKLVTGGEFEEMKQDRNFWRQLALDGLHTADKAVDAVRRRAP